MEQDREDIPTKTKSVAAALALSMLLASLGTSIVNVALPDLAQTFAAPFHDVQGVVVAYLGAMTIVTAIAGRLGDRRGLKPMLTLGLSIFLLASCLCALAPNLGNLLAFRAVQGAGAAFLMTLTTALMRRTAKNTEIGRAMGLLGTMSALGTALGPAIGGLLIPVTGWRGLFGIQVPLAAAALLLSLMFLPAAEQPRQTSSPAFRTTLDRSLVPHMFLNVVVASVMMTTLVIGPFYLGFGLGLPSSAVGTVMAIGPIVSILSGVPAGRFVDAAGSASAAIGGLLLLALGSFLLALLPNFIGVVGYAVALLVLTPGYQLFQAANNTAALADVPPHQQATVSGLLGLSRNIGLLLGASALGAMFAWSVGTEHMSEAGADAVRHGTKVTFLLAGAITSGAAGFAVRRKYLSGRPWTPSRD